MAVISKTNGTLSKRLKISKDSSIYVNENGEISIEDTRGNLKIPFRFEDLENVSVPNTSVKKFIYKEVEQVRSLDLGYRIMTSSLIFS